MCIFYVHFFGFGTRSRKRPAAPTKPKKKPRPQLLRPIMPLGEARANLAEARAMAIARDEGAVQQKKRLRKARD